MRSLFAERSMFQIIFDLYAAGTETSSTGLLWIVLYLIKYPVVQTKCAAEIKRVRPRDHYSTFNRISMCMSLTKVYNTKHWIFCKETIIRFLDQSKIMKFFKHVFWCLELYNFPTKNSLSREIKTSTPH